MSNFMYAKAGERLLAPLVGGSAPVAGTLKAALVKNTYPQSQTGDEFYTAISAYVVGTPIALASVTRALGILDAADIAYTAVAAGNVCEAVVIYMDTGVAGTSWLVAYIDQISNFPVTTNGGDVDVNWDNGPYKIITLG
jgi:hypothetical protein